jgi:trimeric autotransporter adhesin
MVLQFDRTEAEFGGRSESGARRMRRITIVAALVVFTFCVGEAHAGVFSGLEGYWSFDGTAADLSGNGNNLSLFGDATFASGGQFGEALSLDGVEGSYAEQTTDNGSDFTIQVWVNFTSKSSEQTLIEDFTGGGGPGWTFTTPGVVQFYANPYGAYNGGASFSTGVWNQFIVERNGNTIDIYYDDVLVETGTISGAISASSNPLLIGARDAADGRNFTVDGLIDDVGIWDRALSPDEIAELWNDGNGLEFGAAVPEASTWAMLVLGFAGLGLAGHRRRSKGRTEFLKI